MARNPSQSRSDRHAMMTETSMLRLIPILALPMMSSLLIDSFYNLADTYFVSQLGTAATAAVGVNDSLLHLLRALAIGFGMGAASYLSRLLGAKDYDRANRVAATTLFTSAAVLSALAAAAFIFVDPMVTALGATPTVHHYSVDYARLILISAPFTAGEVALTQLLRSEGSTRYAMLGMVSGCVINVALDPLFIYTLGMEVGGAALATTLSKVISFIVLLLPFLRKRSILEIHPRYFTPRWHIYREVGRMGVPAFIANVMLTLSVIVTNNLAGGFGDTALASVSVATKCMRVIGAAVAGFGMGTQPVVGYCYGARHYARVREAFWTCTGIGAVLSFALGLAMFLLAPSIVGVFTASKDPEILRIGTRMIRAQCITMFPHASVMITRATVEGLGKALAATFLGLARQVICLIPVLLILSRLYGVNGLSVAQAVADVLSMLFGVLIMSRQLRELRRLEEEAPPAVGS